MAFSEAQTAQWEPVEYPSLNPILMRPVAAGLWRLHETFDGTYTVDDLFDIIEVMDVDVENKARQNKWAADHPRG